MIDFLYKKYTNLNKKKVFKLVAICVFVYVVFRVFEREVSADIFEAIGEPNNFTDLVGNGKFLESPFRSNYYLDIKSVSSGLKGTFNEYGNWLANMLWYGLTIITYMLIMLFNLAFSMDISDMFKEVLNTIMTSLKNSVFDEYFILIVSIALIYIAISFFRNNIGQLFSRLGYIILTIAIMGMATKYSADIVSGMTTLSKSIGANSIVAISDRETTENNIGQISGELWASLVHTPWLELEFDGKYNSLENKDDIVNKIFSLKKESNERQEYIDKLNEGNPELFKENAGSGRILPALLISIVNIFKMFVMIVIALVQIVFQILTILFVIAFPFLLLLSMSPSFGGVNLISNWWNQILGSQLGIVLTSFLLGLLIKIDGLIATYLGELGTYGWFGITLVQTAIYIGIILQRKQIFRVLMSLQSKVSRSGAGVWRNTMRTTEKGIDGLKNAGGAAADKVKGKAEDLKDAVRKKATTFGDKVRAFNDEHFDRETVGDRIRNYNKAKAEEQRKSRESAAKQKATKDNTSKTQSRQTQDINRQEGKSYTTDQKTRPNIRQNKDEHMDQNINQAPAEHNEKRKTEEKVENIKRPSIDDLAQNIKNNNSNKNNISKGVKDKNSKNNIGEIRKNNLRKTDKKEIPINKDISLNRKIGTVEPKEINSDSINREKNNIIETSVKDNSRNNDVEIIKDVPIRKNNEELIIESRNEDVEADESNTIILNKSTNRNNQISKDINIKKERKSTEEKIRKVENNERKIIKNQEKAKINISNIDRAKMFRKNINNKK